MIITIQLEPVPYGVWWCIKRLQNFSDYFLLSSSFFLACLFVPSIVTNVDESFFVVFLSMRFCLIAYRYFLDDVISFAYSLLSRQNVFEFETIVLFPLGFSDSQTPIGFIQNDNCNYRDRFASLLVGLVFRGKAVELSQKATKSKIQIKFYGFRFTLKLLIMYMGLPNY